MSEKSLRRNRRQRLLPDARPRQCSAGRAGRLRSARRRIRYVTGRIGDLEVVFLARHGKGHRILPSELNYRANIYGMKSSASTHLLSVSTAGSMKEAIKPGDLVVPDQFIDRTLQAARDVFRRRHRRARFAGRSGLRRSSRAILSTASREAGATTHEGGTYLCIEGPQFSTPRRVEPLSKLGRRRYQHDRDAGGASRQGSGALLRDAGAGDRL